jgi:ketosteroid isomerase-like protein
MDQGFEEVTDMDTESARLLGELLSEREILRTLHAYGHGLDYGDEALFMDCWQEDAILARPISGEHAGHDAILRAFKRHTHAPDVYHKHFLVEPLIRLSGDEASVDSMFARLDVFPDGPQMSTFGRYRDRLRRCPDGRWRFVRRDAEIEASRPTV